MHLKPVASHNMLGYGKITGPTPLEGVEALRRATRIPRASVPVVMEDVAARCMLHEHGAYIRAEIPGEFIEDLIRYDLLTAVDPGCLSNREGGE